MRSNKGVGGQPIGAKASSIPALFDQRLGYKTKNDLGREMPGDYYIEKKRWI